jgi:hypothetical protein
MKAFSHDVCVLKTLPDVKQSAPQEIQPISSCGVSHAHAVSGDNVSSLRCMDLIEAPSRTPRNINTLDLVIVKINSSMSPLNTVLTYCEFFIA